MAADHAAAAVMNGVVHGVAARYWFLVAGCRKLLRLLLPLLPLLLQLLFQLLLVLCVCADCVAVLGVVFEVVDCCWCCCCYCHNNPFLCREDCANSQCRQPRRPLCRNTERLVYCTLAVARASEKLCQPTATKAQLCKLLGPSATKASVPAGHGWSSRSSAKLCPML